MNTLLTSLQAYKAMIYFLGDYYDKMQSDDLGSLLGDMQLLGDDGGTWDQAAWHDWMKALGTGQSVTRLEGFNAMIAFLDAYHRRTAGSSGDIKTLLDGIQLQENRPDSNPIIWGKWVEAVTHVVRK